MGDTFIRVGEQEISRHRKVRQRNWRERSIGAKKLSQELLERKAIARDFLSFFEAGNVCTIF